MKNCYLCGEKFNDKNVIKHDEHIIPNAIGGTLTKHDILCKKCGNILGSSIDKPFTDIFNSISARLDIKKDRNKGFPALSGILKHTSGDIEVIWKDFKVSPKRPFHEYHKVNKTLKIYGTKKAIKSYKNKVISDIGLENIIDVIEISDLSGLLEFSFDLDNKVFKRGLAKIAIGFASSHNIERDDLPLVIDTDYCKIKDKIIAIPFYPLSIIDKIIESKKDQYDYYPSHSLILFTLDYDPSGEYRNKKVLMCYIELFSTFQYYIVLNDLYEGNSIYEYFSQQLLKKDDYKVELGRRYYKERNLWLDPLGITEEYIKHKFDNRTDKNKTKLDVETEIIQEETIKQKYFFDFKDNIDGIINHISTQKILENIDKTKNFNDIFEFKNNLDLFYELKRDYIESIDEYDEYEIFHIENYRRRFFEKEKLKNYYTELLYKVPKLYSKGKLKEYNYMKFNMLMKFINKSSLEKKLKESK